MKNMKKRTVRVLAALIAAGLIGVIIAAVQFCTAGTPTFASSSIELLYDKAAQGLTPDGKAFVKDTVRSTEIIGAALAELGWSERYDAGKISDSMDVIGSYPEGIVGTLTSTRYTTTGTSVTLPQTDFFPTTYTVRLYDRFSDKISRADLQKLLGKIMSVYEKSFYQRYSATYSYAAGAELLPLSDFDYIQQIDVLAARIDALSRFAEELYEANPSFTVDGAGFRDIVLQCDAMTEISLVDIRSTIQLQALSKKPSRMINQYERSIASLTFRLNEQQALLTAINKMVTIYPKADDLYFMTGTSLEMIPGNSEETYNKMITMQRDCNGSIASISSTISDYTDRLQQLRSSSSQSLYNKVDLSIATLSVRIEDTETRLDELLAAYNEKLLTEHNSLSIGETDVSAPSILSASFLFAIVKCAGPLCVIVLCGALVLSIIREHFAYTIRQKKHA